MYAARLLLPAFLLAACFCGESQAQSRLSGFHATYQVQVLHYHWTSDRFEWRVEFETADAQEAEMVLDLLEFARDNGGLIQILGKEAAVSPIDVRLVVRYRWFTSSYKDPSPSFDFVLRR